MTRAKRITLPEVLNDRGRLIFAEHGRHIPFAVKRIFAIYEVPTGASRGGHAHRVQQQLLIMLAGACTLLADDGTVRIEERMQDPTEGIYIPSRLWIELSDFTAGSVCLVLASDLFDEQDYIRDYGEFKRLAVTAP